MKTILSNTKDFWNGCKTVFVLGLCLISMGAISGCSTNPATGESQFTALMSPAQEERVGAEQHAILAKQYRVDKAPAELQNYVNDIGRRLAVHTERPEVTYRFFILDSPIVNAFALPGGYVYVSRGLMALARNEAELAAVIGHEIAHITARHSAERYSQGVVTSLGATVLAAALESPSATRAFGLGSELYLKSYSRTQEHEADELGIRYLHRAGYNPEAMASFLSALEAYTVIEKQVAGQLNKKSGLSQYFLTHPQTEDRVNESIQIAAKYGPNDNKILKEKYLKKIDGLIFGDNNADGFFRGDHFYHPELGFTFELPSGMSKINKPDQIVASDKKGTIIIFDSGSQPAGIDIETYMRQIWMKDELLQNVEAITIHNKKAVTASFKGRINRERKTIRLVAVEWGDGTVYRFQLAIPSGIQSGMLEALKRTTYSLRPMTTDEKKSVQPYRIEVDVAEQGDTLDSLVMQDPLYAKMPELAEQRFRVLNGLSNNESLQEGRLYKVIRY